MEPYLKPEIERFCRQAGASTNPVFDILPATCAADSSGLLRATCGTHKGKGDRKIRETRTGLHAV